MSRLTTEERRRAAELRRTIQSGSRAPSRWKRSRNTLRAAHVARASPRWSPSRCGGAMALIQIGQQIALYGPASLRTGCCRGCSCSIPTA